MILVSLPPETLGIATAKLFYNIAWSFLLLAPIGNLSLAHARLMKLTFT